MSSQNPQIYYEAEENHGNYVYISLEDIVNNFWQNQTGDGTVLGPTKRHQILYWAKKGLQQFNFDVLKEVKAVELELNETLDIILPPDYVSYVRISWVNPETGDLMPMSKNTKLPLATAYLQDNDANILFDDEGNILEGSTFFSEKQDSKPNSINVLPCATSCNGCGHYEGGVCGLGMYSLDTTRNNNGDFNIDTRKGKIHFSSDNLTRVIMLEYISDGLEYSNENDIKVNKMAEMALYAWINWNITSNKLNIQEYIVRRAKKDYDTAVRNAKIKLMDLRLHELVFNINGVKKWFK
jgi:hypothetical protein